MQLSTTLTPELTLCRCLGLTSQKKLFETIATLVSDADHRIKGQHIFERLNQREKLGSTALGHGIAIPHARIENLNSPLIVLITLAEPLNFDVDQETNQEQDQNDQHAGQIDIVFALLVPIDATQGHLDLLGQIAHCLQDSNYREKLRAAHTAEALYKAAMGSTNSQPN